MNRRAFLRETMSAACAVTVLAVVGTAVLGGCSREARAPDDYRVFLPEGPGPHPAIVFASGCGGFTPPLAPKTYERAAHRFRAEGYVVVFADYLGRRGLRDCHSGRIYHSQAGTDIVAASAWLRSQPFVDPTRISAIGWSFGGGAILAALADHSAEELGFSRAIVYYPTCSALRPWNNPAPVLMLLAGADDIAPPDACEKLVNRSATPDTVKILVYPAAHHGFDVPELPPRMTYQSGTFGHDPRAAASAQEEIDRFLKASE